MNSPSTPPPLVELRDLTFGYGDRVILKNLSFNVPRGQVTALMGVSGGGKTTVLRLIGGQIRASAGQLLFDGQDLMTASEREMRALRGPRIAMVMQDPKYSLNPVMQVGAQLMEGLRQRDRVGRAEARRAAIAALQAVQIRDPERVMQALAVLESQPAGDTRLLRQVADYSMPNVSDKVVRIIHSYVDYVNRVVWKKY